MPVGSWIQLFKTLIQIHLKLLVLFFKWVILFKTKCLLTFWNFIYIHEYYSSQSGVFFIEWLLKCLTNENSKLKMASCMSKTVSTSVIKCIVCVFNQSDAIKNWTKVY